MKRIISILLSIILILSFTGCGKEKDKNENMSTIIMNCNGNSKEYKLKVGEKLTCELLGDEYEFKIEKITDGEITMEVNEYGLTDTGSLLDKKDSFVIKKGKTLKLNTQSTDYQETVTFEIK